MTDRPNLTIVKPPADYDTRPTTDAWPYDESECVEEIFPHRPSYFAEVAADWRDIISEVRGSPYSHGLVALAAIVFWTAVLVVPTMIGLGK